MHSLKNRQSRSSRPLTTTYRKRYESCLCKLFSACLNISPHITQTLYTPTGKNAKNQLYVDLYFFEWYIEFMAVRRNISQKDLLAEDKKPLSERNAEEKQKNAAEQAESGEKKKKEKKPPMNLKSRIIAENKSHEKEKTSKISKCIER